MSVAAEGPDRRKVYKFSRIYLALLLSRGIDRQVGAMQVPRCSRRVGAAADSGRSPRFSPRRSGVSYANRPLPRGCSSRSSVSS